MLILALDTTTRAGSVAIADDDHVLAVLPGDAARTHGERLPAEIDAALREACVAAQDIDLLVVGSGPGAFTGLRIGLAAMQGLAMTLDRPIVGVSALDALAWTVLGPGWAPHNRLRQGFGESRRSGAKAEGVPYVRGEVPYERGDEVTRVHTSVATWMDAQRGEVFSAVYRPAPAEEPPWIAVAEPAVGAPDATIASGHLDRRQPTLFIGDGARRYADVVAAASPAWTSSPLDPLLAPALAWLGRRQAARGGATAPHALQPLYVRRPDAEIERDRRIGP